MVFVYSQRNYNNGYSPEVLDKYKPEIESSDSGYSLENYEHLKGSMLDLYYLLRKRILNIDSSVKEEYKKLYIAFKSGTNFVDIVPQKARLRLSLNMEFDKINDPKRLCKDITDLGRWGNGNIEVGISSSSQLNDVMDLIQQAFVSQSEAGE
ncbi:MAG: DUF5655 domain-containing protein [Puia sp.]|nr:DUF5655 domain-containing protein [Puia sp.]